jgi:hypothetical protein
MGRLRRDILSAPRPSAAELQGKKLTQPELRLLR